MAFEIRPVEPRDRDALAALLERRHAAHRAAEPLVAGVDAGAAVDDVLGRAELCAPMVALHAGEPVAYLAGEVRENRFWGRHAWVDRAAQAARDHEALRDLYAAAAPAWIDAGARLHLAVVPATPEGMSPWYRLAFSQMQVIGIRAAGAGIVDPPAGVTVRLAGREELEGVARSQGRLIWDAQVGSPVFTGLEPPEWDEELAAWVDAFGGRDTLWVAERDGELLGHVYLYPAGTELGEPADAVMLSTAAVLPGARGGGIGVALATRAIAWAREAGYGAVVADWRVTNLGASRFWPARGFRPAFHRMSRMIGIG
jgi:GNAT superfamily N-acetyltransferase